MKNPKIVLMDYGLGNRIGDKIEINKHLLNHPKLYEKVLNHELKHYKGEKGVDFKEPFDKELFRFIIKTPSTWIHFIPIWVREGKIIISKSMAQIWAIILCTTVAILVTIKFPEAGLIFAVIMALSTLKYLKWLKQT